MDLAGSAKESGTHATHAVECLQNTWYVTLMIRCLAYHPWCRRIGLDGLSLKGTMRPGPRHMGNKCRKESMKKWTTIYGIQLVSFLKLVYSPSRYFALPALIPPQLSSFCSSLPLGIPSPSFLPSNPLSPAAVSPPSIHPSHPQSDVSVPPRSYTVVVLSVCCIFYVTAYRARSSALPI